MMRNTMMQRYGGIAGIILISSGCAVGPNYQRPDTAAPATWQEGQQNGVDVQAAPCAGLARLWSGHAVQRR